MTISIPDSIKKLVDQEVASGAFPTAEDYIRALVEADQKRKGLDRLEALILEGLDSPLSEMTAQDWDDIRREGLAQLHSQRNPG
jgi:putative addiction module CopG family antidote